MDDKKDYHGTITGYTTHKCRCDKCREAWKLYQHSNLNRQKEYKCPTCGEFFWRSNKYNIATRYTAKPGPYCNILCNPARARRTKPVTHGTANGYSYYKCRCRPCTDAWAAYCRKLKNAHKANKVT